MGLVGHGAPGPCRLGHHPLSPCWPPGEVDPWNPSEPPGTIPANSRTFRNPEKHFPYMNLYLRTILELLVMYRILSETLNYLRTHHYEYPITTLALPNVKCVTLWVQEHADMTKTPLRSIINSGTWMPIMNPTYSTKIFIGLNHDVKDSDNPVFNSLCLAIFYLPEIRSSVSPYLVQSRPGKFSLLVL